ncbi:MAG: hypothetical protein R2867_11680 [Caldilineaceae bacterium]
MASLSPADPTKARSQATVIIHTAPLILTDWARFYTEGCPRSPPLAAPCRRKRSTPASKIAAAWALHAGRDGGQARRPAGAEHLLDIHGNVAENKRRFFVSAKGGAQDAPCPQRWPGSAGQRCWNWRRNWPSRRGDRLLLRYLHRRRSLLYEHPYCIMPATKFNGLPVGDGQVGPLTQRLLAAWSELVGVDIVAQAQQQVWWV